MYQEILKVFYQPKHEYQAIASRTQSSCNVVNKKQQFVPQEHNAYTVASFSNMYNKRQDHRKTTCSYVRTADLQIRNNHTNTFENVLVFLDLGAQGNLIEATSPAHWDFN